MTGRHTDIAVGAILLGVSLLWCGYVVQTIPAGSGGGDIGPRALPLLFGALLGLLSAGMMLHRLLGRADETGNDAASFLQDDLASDADAGLATPGGMANLRDEAVVIALVFGLLFFYGWALRMIGFNLATFLVVALTMLLCLRESSLRWIAGMSIGVTFACWLLFGKLLGIPLATGTWISLG